MMSTTTQGPVSAGGRQALAADSPRARRMVAGWLLVCCALVASMVVLGGVTRLTGSGLSMVDWKPVHGVVPPLTPAGWEEAFAQYRTSPEYVHRNAGMTLDGFKRIFWFEYAHRLLGRSVGLAFLLPLLWLLFKRMVEPRLVPHLLLMFVLGGAQGLLGWWMVKSGLVDEPHVSPYRLTAHLGLAVALYLWMLWTALSLLAPSPASGSAAPARYAQALLLIGFLTVLSGGFVAGLHAGLVYNTFPTMAGHWVPPDLLAMSPPWRNLFENVTTVQFDHRLLATLLSFGVVALGIVCLRSVHAGAVRIWAYLAMGAVVLQFGLGVATLLARVPVALAALHQTNALVLLTALTGLALALRRARRRTVV